MKKEISKKSKWTIAFLGVTALAIIMELISAFDKNPDTTPWTMLIVDNIPWFVALPAIGLFATWLVSHFLKYYKEKIKTK
jgi:hypothetical protein